MSFSYSSRQASGGKLKIRISFLALGLVALVGSLVASSQHISASEATPRAGPSPAAGPSVLGTDRTRLAGAIPAPADPVTYTTFMPIVTKDYVQGIFGYLTQRGAPVGGISLELWLDSGSSPLRTATTNSAGYYLFAGIPALDVGQSYNVMYQNPEFNDSRLRSWVSADVTSFTPSSSVFLGTSDLANIPLVAPDPKATIALPFVFEWTRRTATPSDSYFWKLFDPYSTAYKYSDALGYSKTYPLNSLPSGFSQSVQYGWDVGVLDSSGGIGTSYYYRTVTFSNSGASILGPLNVAPRFAGRRNELAPPPHPEE
jgi:hypothetical protein